MSKAKGLTPNQAAFLHHLAHDTPKAGKPHGLELRGLIKYRWGRDPSHGYEITQAGKIALAHHDRAQAGQVAFKPVGFQIVDAATRGDSFYQSKRGWYWHEIEEQGAIIVASITGPFASALEARTSFFDTPRHQQGDWIEFP